MKILNFEAKNVHKLLNYDIKLNERLTFLIGINGSGKTSVLKLILGLISPSYNYLSSIDHDFAKLTCADENGKLIEISSTKINELKYEIVLAKEGEEPVIGKLNSNVRNEDEEFDYEEYQKKSNRILQMFDSQDVVKEIKQLSTPLFLGLDRRVYEGQQIDKIHRYSITRRRYRNYPKNDPLNISLIDIQEVIYDYFRLIASKQPQINEEFKNKILHQSFEFIQTREFNVWKDGRELSEKKEKALEAFTNLNVDGITESVNNFFELLSKTLDQFTEVQKKRDGKKELDPDDIDTIQKWFNNQPQLRKIDELIEYNQSYQNEIENLFEPIEKAKNIINKFFSESKKELIIDAQGELKIKFKNDNIVNIYELSSGEKQIVTMLGHLIFFVEKYKKESGIFIIDEPEVSLHLAWQEIFVEAILNASPNTQFILATHSPAIIGDTSEDLCNDLAKLN
ncbi:AAA family ATPase [Cellulophaga baltica]|uniref:AAA family ATPase n=1 Tax=Cellulophaga TaxID=104264 RepID=UPI001C07B47D|nr:MULTISPECIES: AAA family ATPase [Cellulophaga]MBU2994816.1 AAA family ATPase [Cellulophaga baltica]MDO6766211.1 AAA family ATPase [Cellulophaga sp. 1_MG-2023]